MIEFSIPGVPVSLNRWSRAHWRVRYALARDWRLRVLAARPVGLSPVSPAVVTLTFIAPRRQDPDNSAKLVIDALVTARLLVDDGPPHISELRLRSVRGKPARTEVRIERA